MICPEFRGGGIANHLAIVDYFKAICIIFVILNHSNLFDKTMPLFTLTIDKAVPVFMILSGYVFSLSAKDKSIKQLYNFATLKRKFIRFTLPMSIAFTIYLLLKFISGSPLMPFEIFKSLALATYGSGAYYYNLMIEFIFLAPLMYKIIKHFDANGIILIGGVNFIYETLCSAYEFHTALYRVIIIRYLFAIALGMYIGRYKERKISPVLLGTILAIGATYILLPYAWDYSYKIFTYNPWGRTSMLSVLYVFPIVYILLDGLSEYKSRTLIGKAAERIGRSSYHIMYTQMIYYAVRPTFDKTIFDISTLHYAVQLVIDISVTVVAGIMFETLLTRMLAIKFQQ